MAVKIAQAATDTVLQPVSWPDPVQLPDGGGGSTSSGMDHGERIARLEGGFAGLRTGHTLLIAASVGFATLLLAGIALIAALQISAGSRLDTLSERVGALEVEIRSLPQQVIDALNASAPAGREMSPEAGNTEAITREKRPTPEEMEPSAGDR